MLEEGIPFVLENSQVYMPFLGMLLRPNETRTIKPCSRTFKRIEDVEHVDF
jgi:hypothetical protein